MGDILRQVTFCDSQVGSWPHFARHSDAILARGRMLPMSDNEQKRALKRVDHPISRAPSFTTTDDDINDGSCITAI
ncbi:MAG: hypothetical protein ACRC9V_03035 [Aeromonas sp.]